MPHQNLSFYLEAMLQEPVLVESMMNIANQTNTLHNVEVKMMSVAVAC